MTATYAGIPIAQLGELDDITRAVLLRRLAVDCREAARRNRIILARRQMLATRPARTLRRTA